MTVSAPTADERSAAAELIALGLIADGDLANPELETLERHGIARLIGVSQEALIRTVASLCHRLLEDGGDASVRVLDAGQIDGLLERIGDPALRVTVCRALLVLGKSDGEISDPEQSLLRQALTAWRMQLDGVAG